jgi:DNA-directed RNA polymerase subunit E'/Rpb7
MSDIVKPYINTELRTKVALDPSQMNNDIYINLKTNLKNKVENKCNEYGFIETVHKIIEYNHGVIEPDDFDCYAYYDVKYSAKIYIPIEETTIICKIEKIHRPLLMARHGPILSIIKITDLDTENFKLDNNKIMHISSQKELQVGDYVKLIIRAKKINLRDTKINILGFIMDLAKEEEVKKYYITEVDNESDEELETISESEEKVRENRELKNRISLD